MVGYGKRCKLCNSSHRAEVENMREQGASLSKISVYMESLGEPVSKPAIKRHFDDHFHVQNEVAKRYYEQSETVMEEAVEKRLTDIQMLDDIIERQYRLHKLAGESIQESLTTEFPVILKNGKPMLDPENDYAPVKRKFPPSKPMVDLLNGTAAEIRQAMKVKAELLGDGGDDIPTIVVGLPEGFEDDDDS